MKSINVLKTKDEVIFAIRGEKPAAPAPTLVNFAGTYLNGLAGGPYNKVGHLLERSGFLTVSIDIPGHGADQRDDEPPPMVSWAERLKRGEKFIAKFTKQVSSALTYLIDNGYTDPDNTMISGTSRGGFLAAHCAAADLRFRCAAYIAPVCDLRAITEFADMQEHPGAKAIALNNLVPKLVNTAQWLMIGNRDDRVSTDDSIAFTRLMVAECRKKKKFPDIELHVMSNDGHSTPPTSHREAAAWFKAHLR